MFFSAPPIRQTSNPSWSQMVIPSGSRSTRSTAAPVVTVTVESASDTSNVDGASSSPTTILEDRSGRGPGS